MLFNVLFVVLVVYVLITPYFYSKAVKFGMKVCEDPQEASEMTTFHIPKRKKPPKMTQEEERTMKILQNIDRYDGTGNGQVKI